MSEIESNFSKLSKRKLSAEDKERLFQTQKILGLRDNDALWLVIFALQDHLILYRDIPEAITKVSEKTLRDFRSTLDAQVVASLASARSSKEETVVNADTSLKPMATGVGLLPKIGWLTLGCLAITAAFTGMAWQMHRIGMEAGYQTGFGKGYTESRNEAAAASWAATPEGRLAFELAKKGQLQMLAKCEGKGWKISNNVCFPMPVAGEGVHGWALP